MRSDGELLALVTSANVACGFHAGGVATMRAICAEAVARGVAIGAHIGYRDRVGFGRRSLDVPAEAVEAEAAAQIRELESHARAAGGRVAYVKPHGALYHRASIDEECARAIAVAAGELAVLAAPVSALLSQARQAVPEGYADRAYAVDGTLVPRGEPGALLDASAAGRQAVALARAGTVRSICVHGDGPDAAEVARCVVGELTAAGFELRSFA